MLQSQLSGNVNMCRAAGMLLCVALELLTFSCMKMPEAYGQQPSASHDRANDSPATFPPYTRIIAHYEAPDVTVTSMDGTKARLAVALKHDGPVILQFIFTTCPTICPVMSTILSAAQNKLGADLDKVRMISISIDPEHDTPERLRQYALKFKAGRQWLFLTGSTEDIAAIQKAFDAYRGSKMRHEPLTFLRSTPGDQWVRLEGLMNATQLVAEYKLLTTQ